DGDSALYRIVIGEKDVWGNGYGTEATRLVVEQAFEVMGLHEVRLEVFHHNTRALGAYARVGFEVIGEHVEWVARKKTELRVIEMSLREDRYRALGEADPDSSARSGAIDRVKREERHAERNKQRAAREANRARRLSDATAGPIDSPNTKRTDMD
nr:GNAT family N-acetyltransferase [Chloroflexia bacterium]